jgi:hypothetical protein
VLHWINKNNNNNNNNNKSVYVNVFSLKNCSPSSGLPGSYCTTSLSSQEYRKIPSATVQPAVKNEY